MKFNSQDNGDYCLAIYALEDMPCMQLAYKVDNKEDILPLSNQGHYAIYLNTFSHCEVLDETNIQATLKRWNPFYEEVLKKYRTSILDFTLKCNFEKESLFVNLPEEKTEYLYIVFKRLLSLTKKAITEKDTNLREWILTTLSNLVDKEYNGKTNYIGNWWVYEIGIPKALNEIIILLYDNISKEDILRYMAIENFYIPDAKYIYYRRNYPNKERKVTNYANLADTIYICLLKGILLQSQEEIKYLYTLLPNVLQIVEEGNGFYKDGSFIYHDTIPYNASYGEVLLDSLSKILELYVALKYDCTGYFEKLYTLIDKAYIPFLYHQRALDCVRGRAISRRADCHYSFQTIMSSFHRLAKLYSKQGFLDMVYNEEECYFYKPKAFVFNYMDRYIKRNNDYLIAISAHSKNVANYESINGENLYGDYQANFTYDLYFNEMPEKNEILKVNSFYRNGSTNTLEKEEPNKTMQNLITAGVSLKGILNTCYHQNNSVTGYFSKIVLPNSLLAIGTNISSSKPYVSTVYSFCGPFYLNKNGVETNNCRIHTKTKPIIETMYEKRSFQELNLNERDEPYSFDITRIYYKNPTEYLYQIYPRSKNVKDDYLIEYLKNAHIVIYRNLYLINVFNDERVEFKDFIIQGRVCLIAERTEDVIIVSFATDVKQDIYLKINGFTCSMLEDNRLYIEDELEHTLVFRRDV